MAEPRVDRRAASRVLIALVAVVFLGLASGAAALALYLFGPVERTRTLVLEHAGAPLEIRSGGRSLGTTPLVLDDGALEPFWRADLPGGWPTQFAASGSSVGDAHSQDYALVARDPGTGREENVFYLREERAGGLRYLVLPFRAIDEVGGDHEATSIGTSMSAGGRRVELEQRIHIR